MRGRSALLRRLLVKLNWLSLLTPKSAANLGTPQADVIFSKVCCINSHPAFLFCICQLSMMRHTLYIDNILITLCI